MQSLWPRRDVGLPSQGCRCLGWVPPWDEAVLSVGINPIIQKSNIYVWTSQAVYPYPYGAPPLPSGDRPFGN